MKVFIHYSCSTVVKHQCSLPEVAFLHLNLHMGSQHYLTTTSGREFGGSFGCLSGWIGLEAAMQSAPAKTDVESVDPCDKLGWSSSSNEVSSSSDTSM